ncbi:MAG: peptidase MA family metallohydrolase [Anaerolineae bacterium]
MIRRWINFPNPSKCSTCRTPVHPLSSWLLVMAFVTLFTLSGLRVRADSPILIQDNDASYVFSRQIDFTLQASSDSPISAVILFYGQEDERLVRRIYPPFQAGKSIKVDYTEELTSGQFAPGTTLIFYWLLTCEDGTTLKTDALAFEYTDTNHKWKVIAGEGVDLYWYGTSSNLAKELATKADADSLVLQERFGITLERRLRVYVYNNTTDMGKALSSRSEGYDAAVTTLGVAVDRATLLLLGSHRNVRMTLAHELSHLVVGLATDNPFTDLPRWLDEGLAMYAEGKLPSSNQTALDRGIRDNKLLSIRSMTSYSGKASEVDLYYAEAYSIVDFMIRDLGEDKLQQLLQVMSQGARQEDALQQVYSFGLDELDARWRASIGAEAAPTIAPTAKPGSTPVAIKQRTAAPTVNPSTTSTSQPCTFSLGALLFPLLGGVMYLGRRGNHGVG